MKQYAFLISAFTAAAGFFICQAVSPFLLALVPAGSLAFTLFLLVPLPLIFSASLFPVFYAAGSFRAGLDWLGFRRLSRKDILPVLNVIPLYFILFLVNMTAEKMGLHFPQQAAVRYACTCSTASFVFLIFSVLILAPLSEELIYRSVLNETLKGFIANRIIRIFAVSLIFALSHGLIFQGVSLFVLAVYLQIEKDRPEGSVSRTVLMHSVFNGMTVVSLIFVRLNSYS